MEHEPITFAELKTKTAEDCEAVAAMITELAGQVREGNMAAFEAFWIRGGTEEGDAKIADIRERLVLRYMVKAEAVR